MTPPLSSSSETSRRDFLVTGSTLAVLGTGLFRGVASGAFAGGSDTIRIGLVGCGGRGTGAASQALSTAGPVRLVAMGDAFEDQIKFSLKSLQSKRDLGDSAAIEVDDDHRFVGLDAYQHVIDSDIDLVILATPPGFRPQHLAYAVDRGVHVFTEKPLATDAAGVRRVLELSKTADQRGLKIGVGLQRRHQKSYLDLIGRIHNGDMGAVRALRVYWNSAGVWEPRRTREQCQSELEYQVRNWYYYNWLCGDHICEQHIHNLDVGNWIMRDYPVKANGIGGREVRTDARYGDIFDHHACEFTYADGTVMFSQCRHIPNCWNDVTEHAHCEQGIVHLGSAPRQNQFAPFGRPADGVSGPHPDPYQVEHDDLFAAIRAGTPYNELEYGAMSTMTAILGRMCSYSGKEITMQDALERGPSLVVEAQAWEDDPPVHPDAEGRYPVPVPGVTQVLG